jgi:crotonobetainyl-CoA:carnitine CoA-transferase CaiB-like acyl-CoA transferase
MQMSGMGDGGPWSKFVTYAPTIHALSGLTHLTGIPGREDIGIGFSYNDHQAGLHAAVAILAAIEARRTTGKGQRIDMSQFEVGVNFAGPALLDYFATGTAARPTANRLPYDTAAPHGCYPCAGAASNAVADERWVAIACMSDAHWTALKNVMGNPDWANSPGFESAKGRVDLVDSLDEHLAQWTKTQTAGDVMDSCQKAGVPAGIVQTAIDLAEHDPQLKSSGFLKPLESPFPGIGQTYADKLPLRFQKTPCDVYKRVRQIGEDNSEVLKDWLDMDDEAIEKAGQDGLLS